MALVSGRSPVRLLDEDRPDIWTEMDLEVLSQWKRIKDAKCPSCGRPLAQHLHNSRLGREETVEDYTAYSMDCPAQEAISHGQQMWRTEHKGDIDRHNKGQGPDPSMGLIWFSQTQGEVLPQPEK